MQMDREQHITLAYFEKKSTVDYIGVIQGIPVCFDAKECAITTFSLQNVHEHQIRFMQDFEQQQGIAFFMLYFTSIDVLYYLPLRHFMFYWERAQAGGRKSFRFDELDQNWILHQESGFQVPYLEMINRDLMEREQDEES